WHADRVAAARCPGEESAVQRRGGTRVVVERDRRGPKATSSGERESGSVIAAGTHVESYPDGASYGELLIPEVEGVEHVDRACGIRGQIAWEVQLTVRVPKAAEAVEEG